MPQRFPSRFRFEFRTLQTAVLVPFLAVVLTIVGGCGAPSLLITPVSNTNSLEEENVRSANHLFASKVLLVDVDGMITNARSSSVLLSSGENGVSVFTQQLEKAADDSSVKAVVLRINSPGGTVAASDTLYQEVLRYKEKTGKPVIAYGQDLMASGAYYTACSADVIMAQPTSLVGSIGVIFQSVDLSGTMSIVGVRSVAIKSGPMKDMGSPFKPLEVSEKVVMQSMVDDFFGRFKGLVGKARHLESEKLDAVTDGRVFTGDKALAVGLVDKLGTLNDAIEIAKQKANLSDANVVIYRRPHGYGGSVYAQGGGGDVSSSLQQLLPPSLLLPTGFYYMWMPQF